MKPSSRSPQSGRPPKRKRTDAELNDLARVLGADWTQGDTVQTWIHKHEGKTRALSRMVEEGWLWQDIGRAMHLAGITYRTPVAAPAIEAKAQPLAAAAPMEPPLDAAGATGGTASEEPSFRLVTLKGGHRSPGPPPSPRNPSQEEATEVSDDEILRRVFGKP